MALRSFIRDITFARADNEFYTRTGWNIMLAFAALMFFFGIWFLHILLLGLDGIILLLFLLALIPSAVFSRFRKEYRTEYLQWLAFKAMLMDFARIQRYLKEDYRQWRQWIGYATALGAAENLLRAMKELRVLSAAEYENLHNMHTGTVVFFATAMASSGGGGGGFGGGGFGGGGGGGR